MAFKAVLEKSMSAMHVWRDESDLDNSGRTFERYDYM